MNYQEIQVHGYMDYHQEYLHKRKLYDRYKRMYAKSNGYYYLEIPYWADDLEETWKIMIDDKIKEILSQ